MPPRRPIVIGLQPWQWTILIGAALLILLGAAAAGPMKRWRRSLPRPTWAGAVLWLVARAYSRLAHRVRYEGLEHLPIGNRPGPLIVVSNHTAGIDPILIQAACRFEVRWMMTREMNRGPVRWATSYFRIILVDPRGKDFHATREALRHLRGGGVIGIFPEGGIERPPERLRPFHDGVGFLVAKSGAAVVPAWISGTPRVESAMQSLWRPSRSRVAFGPPMSFKTDEEPRDIAAAIEAIIARMSGWPRAERAVPDAGLEWEKPAKTLPET